ncbi:ovarian cancer-associated protein 2 protein [Perkinsus chesapeaki]|uniref:Ovarian cancer-associated protein 2 protein n=1 Tax=Perkinsus chesapeaki TaxID=330153 RepID=A0A7J6MMD4_PERCH|nr:ovarian cancer-associated protein 2 protein [Perkinsus chesapeaki]
MVAASTASSTSEESDPTLAHRVLCVHGHAQSPEGFRQKTGGIRRQCKRLVHFDFIQGPFEVPADDVFASHDPDSEKSYTWVDPKKESPENLGEFYVEGIAKAMTPETQGLFGFSMGCPAILLAMARYPKAFENVKFIILCGAFFPQNNSEQEAEIRACPLWPKVRAMFICGKSDQVVSEDRSLRVAEMFKDPVIFEHPKGHMVPAEARKDVKAFVQSALSPSAESTSSEGTVDHGGNRLLCVHGHAQTPERFSNKIGPIRRKCKSLVQFDFVKGPFVVPLDERFSHDSDDEDLLTWRQPGIPRGQDKMDVTPIIEGITPDTKGILAFSLGCAAVLVAMAEHPEAFADVKFLIFASGNLPQNPALVEEIKKSSLIKSMPVMLIYGKKDQVVPEDRFNIFKSVFPEPLIATVEACPVISTLVIAALVVYSIQWVWGIAQPRRVAAAKDELTFQPAPLFRRFQLWRLVTYPLVHPDFASLMVSVIHLLFSLDLESTPDIGLPGGANLRCGASPISAGFCYPFCGIGSKHLAVLVLLATMTSVIIGSCGRLIDNWNLVFGGLSTVCYAVDGTIITLYALLAGAGVALPPDPSFVSVRLFIAGLQLCMDLVTSEPRKSLLDFGSLAHSTAFLCGVAYVTVVTPMMGPITHSWPERLFRPAVAAYPRYVVPCHGSSDRCLNILHPSLQATLHHVRVFWLVLGMAAMSSAVYSISRYVPGRPQRLPEVAELDRLMSSYSTEARRAAQSKRAAPEEKPTGGLGDIL